MNHKSIRKQKAASVSAKREKSCSYYKAKPGRKKTKKRNVRRKQVTAGIWVFVAIFLFLAAVVICPHLRDKSSHEKGSPIPRGPYSYGIDVSRYQHKIRWDSLMVLTDRNGNTIRSKTAATDIVPVSFAFIKATEGIAMSDKKFRTHWSDAAEHGIIRGAYHFFRSSKDPVHQAENFIKTVGEISSGDLPPVLDIETVHAGCPVSKLNDNALTWLKTVEEHYGCRPIVYSSAYFISEILCDEIVNEYPIWIAHYGTTSPRRDRWHIWQFTDRALVYGTDGYVDLSVCHHNVLKGLRRP